MRSITRPTPWGNRLLAAAALIMIIPANSLISCGAGADTAQVPEFDGGRAFAYLVKQCDFGPRDPGSKRSLACRDYLVKILRGFAEEVLVQPFPIRFGRPEKVAEGANIIARFRKDKTDRILLCAHWDSRPWADEDPNPNNRTKPVPGANDGASGVAVLLELAGILHRTEPEVGVDIVLFDGEDAGTSGNPRSWAQGSAYFATHFPWQTRPRFGILLDMIGDADLAIEKEINSWTSVRSVMVDLWERASRLGLEAFKPALGLAVYDDHIPLLEAGILCVDLIDFDYPPWHTLEDTPDKCSASSLAQIGDLLVDVIYRR